MRTVTIFLLLTVAASVCDAQFRSSVSLQPHRDPLRENLPISPGERTVSSPHANILNTSTSLDSFFAGYMGTYHIPGLAACIIKRNGIVWQGYYGFANLALNIPVTDSTIFMLASTSKTVTATALMQLFEAGRFQLDDSVNSYLPFHVRNPNQPSVPITFRMLLTHTSSIRDNWNVLSSVYVIGDHPMPLGTFLHEYFTPGGQYYNPNQNFYTYAPGTTWNYCNVGAALCGYLVETISGIPFDRFCRDSIFVPLQMTHTSWFLRDLDPTLIARPYTYSSGTYIDNGLYGYPDYPDGQLRTTVVSLARFLMANINRGELGGSRILDTSTVRLMRTPYVTGVRPEFVDSRWGLIWIVTTDIDGRILWGHLGGDAGVRTSMFLSESDSTGVIILTNASYGDTDWKPGVQRLIAEAETLTVGIREPLADSPEHFQLLQNYPNPFNPSTNIKYQIPNTNRITLKVFDILGREVATLVNEVKEPGTYTVQLDGSNLASGVYFYRLHAGNFVDVKKLILLK